MATKKPNNVLAAKKKPLLVRARRDVRRNWDLYLIILPILIYYAIFHYAPMYGAIIAFQNYKPAKGIFGSQWVGLKNFQTFFGTYYFWTLLKNTLKISVTSLLVHFPTEILLAILINELRSKKFARVVQTVTYMPHCISLVVVCGMVIQFTKSNGIITKLFGMSSPMLNDGKLFLPIYIISDVWQQVGWGSIIYLAALTGIDQQLYEAAEIDGAGRFKQTIYITLPGILPTVTVLFIMRIGRVMSLGADRVLLLYNKAIYDDADIFATYVYRRGIENTDWSYSSAVGLFNSVINLTLVVVANAISRRINQLSIW